MGGGATIHHHRPMMGHLKKDLSLDRRPCALRNNLALPTCTAAEAAAMRNLVNVLRKDGTMLVHITLQKRSKS